MTARTGLPGLAFAAVVAWLGWLLWNEKATPPAATPPEAASATEDVPAVEGATTTESGTGESPSSTKGSEPQLIRMPDGSTVPALNGARDVPDTASRWPSDIPFTPIVGRRVIDGVEWYLHQDGTHSTTVMRFRKDLGRHDALFRVAQPGKKPPAGV